MLDRVPLPSLRLALALLVTGAATAPGAVAQCRSAERVDLTPAGVVGDGNVFGHAALSADGSVLYFTSRASDLVAVDTNDNLDVFRLERASGVIELVTQSTSGEQGMPSFEGFTYPSCSADGRYVVFTSWAPNLISTDFNGRQDVFLRDTLLGTTARMSQDCGGLGGFGNSNQGTVSADGNFVAFISGAETLVFGDANLAADAIVYDRQADMLEIVSVDSSGVQANASTSGARISGDGRWVAFASAATNLVPGDVNQRSDVFLHDRAGAVTTLVSTTDQGALGDGHCLFPWPASDGRFVLFHSTSTNLVPDDTNALRDLFCKDVASGAVRRVNVSSSGAQATGPIDDDYSLSADDRFVVFSTTARLSPEDADTERDVYRHELATGRTTLVSIDGLDPGTGRYPAVGGDAVVAAALGGVWWTDIARYPESFCDALANSSGRAARMDSLGEARLAAGALTLVAHGVPDTSGLFLIGTQRAQLPFGDGLRCVGGSVASIGPPRKGQGGTLLLGLDPTHGALAGITPGATRSFQAWFRDRAAGGAGYNTSDGLDVTFCP